MAKAEQGKIIKDLGKSLPTLEDFFYNDLDGYDTMQLPDGKDAAKILFYQEAPPESAEFLGYSANGALLSIKLPSDAFNTNSVQGIISNALSGNNVRVDLSKAEYGGFDNIKVMLDQYKTNPELSAYLTTVGAYNEDLYNRSGMQFAANLRLLFTNLPEIPRFSSDAIDETEIIKKQYKEIKDKTQSYKFCTIPYPYIINYTESADHDIIANCSNYNQASKNKTVEYQDNDELCFIQKGSTYYQVIPLDRKNENRYKESSKQIRNILVLNQDKSNAKEVSMGYLAKDILIQNIKEAKDIRLVLDVNTLNNQASATTYLNEYPLEYNDNVLANSFSNYVKNLANHVFDDGWYQYAGYVPYGLDKYHRINGVIYVQKEVTKEDGTTDLVWYNLNKMMIAETNNNSSPVSDATTSPTSRYHLNFGPTELKPYTYDYSNKTYVDNFWIKAGHFEEERKAVQRQIFAKAGVNLFPSGNDDEYKTEDDAFYKWTVSLGDVTFFIPPESIRVVSQTETTRIPIMRAKGTIAKGRERSMQYIEMNLFFNEAQGINGVPYVVESPNKKYKLTYHMNGFRALLAQMKFTPFLPIINQYINEDLGIFAVCIENLDVETVPGFPKLLRARILLSKFNYQVYMPEIPLPDNDSTLLRTDAKGNSYIEKRNPFSACIDYDTMRWYYQRCILLGNELDRLLNIEDKAKRITVNSLEFYKRTIFANRTALLPCHFEDPTMSLYIVDEDHLKRLLQIKQDAMKKNLNVSDNYSPSQNESRFIKEADTLATSDYIKTIYAKYMNKASALSAAMIRARNSNNEVAENEIAIDRKNGTIKYKNTVYDFTSDSSVNNFLNTWLYQPMLKEYREKLSAVKNENEDPIVQSVTIKEDNSLTIFKETIPKTICIKMYEDYLSKQDKKNTIRESTVYYKSQNNPYTVKPEDVFKDSEIRLRLPIAKPVVAEISQYENPLEEVLNQIEDCFKSGAINPDADIYNSLRFLDWCHVSGKGIVEANQEAAELKESIDYENVHSLKYNMILQNVLVTRFAASVGNTYARIGVSGIDGSAPQFMGGQDTHLTFTIETKDEYIASTFKSLPELTAYFNRTYRKVLPTYPIKIDSDFTRMFGIIEICLDNVVVTTVPGFPGLYRIIVNAVSVDRTLRNREALKLLDIKQQGLEESRLKTQVNIRSAKDLDEEFTKAEVYPDLELPKISELGEMGWRYIRYRAKERNNNDFYIDPDFYFIYPNLTVGRALIEALRCTFDTTLRNAVTEEDIQQFYTDTTRKQVALNKDGFPKPETMNDLAKQDMGDAIARKINRIKEDPLYYIDRLKTTVFRIPFGSVDIGHKIRCTFMEPYYIQEHKWIKESIKQSEEKILEVTIKDSDWQRHRAVAVEQMNKAKKSANRIYSKISFINDKTKEVIETVDNPNWGGADAKKLIETLNSFEKCADEIEKYLATNNEKNSETIVVSTFSGYDISTYVKPYIKILKQYRVLDKDVDISKLVIAVADSICGSEECDSKNKSDGFGQKRWQASFDIHSVINGETVDKNDSDVNREDAYSYGVFGIKKYTYSQLHKLLPQEEQKELEANFAKGGQKYYVLDPYYRYKDKKIRDEYLTKCTNNPSFCTFAFIRIMMWYIAKLLRYHVIPSVEFDVKRQDNINVIEANKKAIEFLKKNGVEYQSQSTLFTDLKSFAENNGEAFDYGKFFAAILLAITEEGFGANTLFSLYDLRNYKELNQLMQYVMSAKFRDRNENDPTFVNRNGILRRYLYALYGYGLIDDPHNLQRNVTASPANKFLTNCNTKIAAQACGKPAQYMRDSFYDMIRHDYRGRMLRAFPTFYMVFADEGREMGLWKLHDNFYNFNAIHEIQIVKSRKIPADTCKILLSNMFQTFTTNDEDCTINYKGNLGDLWESILDVKSAAQSQELRRLSANKINRAKLQTGVRIHVRMGYGANANDLPCCFNGVIADIKPGELVEIVAQGDGIELCNPIYMEADADIITNEDHIATMDNCVCGQPPKEILQGFLTAQGGPIAAWLRNQYRNNFFFTGFNAEDAAKRLAEENNVPLQLAQKILDPEGWALYGLLSLFKNNPYGLRHFGNPEYRDIFQQGEPAQNLYEITNKDHNSMFASENDDKAYFGDGSLDPDEDITGYFGVFYTYDESPFISFKPYGRTIWDIMHICQSIAPDWVTGVVDFQFRSTIFLGKPHYYYAYKYVRDGDNDTVYEKRKPYQQWHLYNNFSDIVENKISASSEKMKTNAIGTYTVEGFEGGTGINKTATMWVDMDIYPEYQKSMIVDTKLHGKSWAKHNMVSGTVGSILGKVPLLGSLGGWLYDNTVVRLTNDIGDKYFETAIDQRGSVTNHMRTAEDAVINALKNSIKEMYQGYMIVLGDPTVKPNDRMEISDAYEDISGLCDVREVVHSLSAQTGFTTTITPDAISAHDINSELPKMAVAQQMLARGGMAATYALSGYAIGPRLLKKGDKVVEEGAEILNKKDTLSYWQKIKRGINTWAANSDVVKTAADTTKVKKAYDSLKLFGLKVVNTAGGQVAKEAAKKGAGLALKRAGGIATAAISVLGAGVNSWLYRTIKGSQTLYIFPMYKFGKPFTAGLDGQQGLVYGSIQFNTPGPLEKFFAHCFAHNKEDGIWNGVKNFAESIFIDEDVRDQADKFDTELEQDKDFKNASASGTQSSLYETDLQSIAGPQLDKSIYRPNNAFALSSMPRAMVDGIQNTWSPKTSEIQETIWQATKNRFYIDNPKTWIVNPNLRNQVYLEDNLALRHFFESGLLRTIQQVILEGKTFSNKDKDNLITYSVHMASGESKQIVGVKRIEKQNTGEAVLVDLPLLSQDSSTCLIYICKYLEQKTPYFKNKDDNENKQINKDTAIILSSALIPGSDNKLYGSGFHFILTGTGELSKKGVLKQHIQDAINILAKELKPADNSYEHIPLFTIDTKIKQDNEVGINVGVPTAANNNIAMQKQPDNKPTLTPSDKDTEKTMDAYNLSPIEFTQHVFYSSLDYKNRTGYAYAQITYQDVVSGKNKIRKDLRNINPAGFQKDYGIYDRCHLIAHSLEGEEDNPRNLFTGTHEMNMRMYKYEDMVAKYLKDNQNSTVLYKVTPVYNGENLVPSYVIMEASDATKHTALFNTIIYNTQSGWNIDYATGHAKKK